MEMRESFQQIYQSPNKIVFEILLEDWLVWVSKSEIPQMIKVAKSIRKHWDKIVNYATSKITNAILEWFNSIFKDEKNGQYKIISFYAKKARGLMVRWAVQHKAKKVADLRKFDLEGYAFAESVSNPARLVFRRKQTD